MSEERFEPIPFGRYLLTERVAIGGMAEIFKAKVFGAHGFEKTIAVKRILPQLAADPEFVDMFINEARLMVRLAHPKVVQVLDFGQVNGQYFIAMEFVEGLDGLALLRICARHRCRPTTGIAVHIAADVLDALDYAHNLRDDQGKPLGIVHRDISPSNIFISDLGEVKLGDFGIARVPTRRTHTETGELKGKYGYMSPEIVNGHHVDHRSDIFSVGVVLAELLMVRRLFMAKTELEVLLQVRDARLDRLGKYGRHIPPELRRILDSALARDPDLRYQDAASFRDALHHFLFDQKRMIRPIELRSFLGRLRDLEKEGETPTLKRVPMAAVPVGAAPGPPAASLESELPLERTPSSLRPAVRGGVEAERQTEYSARTRERIEVKRAEADGEERPIPLTKRRAPSPDARAAAARVVETPSIGHRRKILLGPPPRPAPMPPIPSDADEGPRMDTAEMLTALTELDSSGSSSHDFKSADSRSAKRPLLVHPPTPAEPMTVAAVQVFTTRSGHVLPLPDLSGELSEHGLAGLLFARATAEQTGLLVLQHETLVKEIYLVDGDPQYVTSNLADELFGQYLVAKGVISEGELAMALATLAQFENKLGNALVALKLLRPVEVLRHLTHQVRLKLLNAFAWESGTFAYYGGHTCSMEAAPLGLDAFEIIGAGVNELPDEVLVHRLQPLLERRPISVSPPPVPPEVFRLGPRPRQVFDELDGRHTLGHLLERFDDRDQRRGYAALVYLLLECGLASCA